MSQINNFSVLILAAGQGKRMNDPENPKVLAKLNGSPLIEHVLKRVQKLDASTIVVVVGYCREKVIDFITSSFTNVQFAVQNEQLGTGHAVACSENLFYDFDGDILILAGDVPLISTETLYRLIELHNETKSDVSVLSSIAPTPYGYGRIIRDRFDNFAKIIEENDADESEKLINEINSGIYIVKSRLLFELLKYISDNNAQKEYYLTDIISIAKANGRSVNAFKIADFNEVTGVNSYEQLLALERNIKRISNYEKVVND